MELQAYKLSVVQKILTVNEPSIISKIDKILESEMIVGYTAEGQPLTKEEYNERIQNAEEQLSKGNVTSQDDLEDESENW